MPEGCQTADHYWQDIADSIYLQLTAQYLKPYSKIKSL